jgi:prephenate dehydrogenase
MLIMDVGSTKRDVVDAARRALREQVGCFVPAHPITGKEVVRRRTCRCRPVPGRRSSSRRSSAPHRQLQQAVDVWTALGCRSSDVARAHDAALPPSATCRT